MAVIPASSSQSSSSKPWLANKEWASPVMHSTGKAMAIGLWVFAIIWCAISAPGNFFIVQEVAKGNYGALGMVLFDVVGFALLINATRHTLAWRKFGDVTLTLDPHPGAIGGQVGGTVEVLLPPDATQVFAIELLCSHVHSSGSGKNRETKYDAIWQDLRQMRGTTQGDGKTHIPFCFDVPKDLPESTTTASNYHRWQLTISAELDGVDFKRVWIIPVFATQQASSALLVSQQQALVVVNDNSSDLMHLQSEAGTVSMHYPAGRSIGTALVLLLFAAIFGGGGALFAHQASGANLVAAAVFGVVVLGLFTTGLWLMANSLRVEVTSGWIKITRCFLGIQVWQKEVAVSQVAGLTFSKGMSSSSGSETRVYYRLVLRTQQGEDFIIGDGFVGYSTVKHAAETFAKRANLKVLPDK